VVNLVSLKKNYHMGKSNLGNFPQRIGNRYFNNFFASLSIKKRNGTFYNSQNFIKIRSRRLGVSLLNTRNLSRLMNGNYKKMDRSIEEQKDWLTLFTSLLSASDIIIRFTRQKPKCTTRERKASKYQKAFGLKYISLPLN